jgi:hypothetical protein
MIACSFKSKPPSAMSNLHKADLLNGKSNYLNFLYDIFCYFSSKAGWEVVLNIV